MVAAPAEGRDRDRRQRRDADAANAEDARRGRAAGRAALNAIALAAVRFAWPGKPTLLDIERFEVAAGERVFLRGPSGSGKSTLLGLIGGVLQPERGEVRILDRDLTRLSASERDRFRGEHVGFVFQMFNLIPYLSVIENVLLPLRFNPARRARLSGPGAGAGSPREEARRLLASLGLGAEDLLERAVTELSIGQQQRVAAARALMGRPELIVADEPTSSLDHEVREDFLRLLMGECRAQSSTLLFVSHDTSLGGLFDRMVDLRQLNRATVATGAA